MILDVIEKKYKSLFIEIYHLFKQSDISPYSRRINFIIEEAKFALNPRSLKQKNKKLYFILPLAFSFDFTNKKLGYKTENIIISIDEKNQINLDYENPLEDITNPRSFINLSDYTCEFLADRFTSDFVSKLSLKEYEVQYYETRINKIAFDYYSYIFFLIKKYIEDDNNIYYRESDGFYDVQIINYLNIKRNFKEKYDILNNYKFFSRLICRNKVLMSKIESGNSFKNDLVKVLQQSVIISHDIEISHSIIEKFINTFRNYNSERINEDYYDIYRHTLNSLLYNFSFLSSGQYPKTADNKYHFEYISRFIDNYIGDLRYYCYEINPYLIYKNLGGSWKENFDRLCNISDDPIYSLKHTYNLVLAIRMRIIEDLKEHIIDIDRNIINKITNDLIKNTILNKNPITVLKFSIDWSQKNNQIDVNLRWKHNLHTLAYKSHTVKHVKNAKELFDLANSMSNCLVDYLDECFINQSIILKITTNKNVSSCAELRYISEADTWVLLDHRGYANEISIPNDEILAVQNYIKANKQLLKKIRPKKEKIKQRESNNIYIISRSEKSIFPKKIRHLSDKEWQEMLLSMYKGN